MSDERKPAVSARREDTRSRPGGAGQRIGRPTASPMISLVVSTIGRPEDLRRMLASIETELRSGLTAELIVVDQSPDDRTRAVLEESRLPLPCRYLRSGIGVSAGRNAGLAEASGTYVMFPDDDAWFGGGLLDRAVEFLEREPGVQVFCGRLATEDGGDSQLRWAKSAQFVNSRNYHRTSIGPAMVFRRDVIVAAGGYDEGLGTGSAGWYGACEDSDMVLRLVESGSRAWYDPTAVIHHREVRLDSGPAVEVKSVLYGCGQGHLWRSRRFSRAWILFLLVRRVVGSAVQVLRGRRDLGRARRAWLRGAVCGLIDMPPLEFRTPAESPPETAETSISPGPAEFVRSFTWRIGMAGAGIVATFALTAYAARALPTDEFALFLVLLVGLSLSPSLSRLGVNHEAIRSLAGVRALGDWADAVRVGHLAVRSCLLPTIVIGPLVAVLVAATGSRNILVTWALVAVVLVTDSLRLTYSDVFMGLGMPRWGAVLAHQIRSIAVVAAVVIDQAFFADGMTLTRLLVLMSGVGIMLVVVGHVRLSRLGTAPASWVGAVQQKAAIVAGVPFLVTEVVGILVARGDIWLSSMAFDGRQAVLYGAAATLANQVGAPVALASVALAPIAAGYAARRQATDLELLVRRVATGLTALLLPLFVITWVAGDEILAILYGEEFRQAHQLLVILMVGNLSFVALGMSAVVLIMAGYQRFAMWLSLSWLAVVAVATTTVAVLGGPTPLAIVSALGSTGFLVVLAVGAWAVTGVRVYPTSRPLRDSQPRGPLAATR